MTEIKGNESVIVWVMNCLYKKGGDDFENWTTAVFLSEERAKEKKKEIEETRNDIEVVHISQHFVEYYPLKRVKSANEMRRQRKK